MVVVSCAVTFTLTVVAPSDSDTWKPSSPESASVSTVSEAFRYATVALLSFTVGSIVISLTLFPTHARYSLAVVAKVGLSAIAVPAVRQRQIAQRRVGGEGGGAGPLTLISGIGVGTETPVAGGTQLLTSAMLQSLSPPLSSTSRDVRAVEIPAMPPSVTT